MIKSQFASRLFLWAVNLRILFILFPVLVGTGQLRLNVLVISFTPGPAMLWWNPNGLSCWNSYFKDRPYEEQNILVYFRMVNFFFFFLILSSRDRKGLFCNIHYESLGQEAWGYLWQFYVSTWLGWNTCSKIFSQNIIVDVSVIVPFWWN